MSDDNAAIVRRIYERGFNSGDEAVYDELYTDDFVHHDKTIFDIPAGAPGEKESMRRFRRAIPDIHFDIQRQIAHGDLVINHLRITGTQVEAFGPMEPTGEPLDYEAVAVFRLAGGLVAEEWFITSGHE